MQACDRCVKSGKICLGYDQDPGFVFRHYGVPGETVIINGVSYRPDQYPMLSPSLPPTPTAQVTSGYASLTDAEIEARAIHYFFDQYCIESRDRSVSRGFLDGFPRLIAATGPDSDLAQAAKLVILTSMGNRIPRPAALERTRQSYANLLARFSMTLADPATAGTTVSLMTAVLLGIYEVRQLPR